MRAALVILVLAACMAAECSRQAARTPAEAGMDSCRSDGECVRVPVDCCGCTMGGKSTAVNRAHQAAWEAARKGRCRGVLCPAVYVCGPEVPRCVEGRCRLS